MSGDEKTNIFCPGHPEVAKDLREIKQKQMDRPCGENTARITALERADTRMEEDNKDQWSAINNLRRLVYMGAGATAILAFLGSVLGAFLKK
jgi:hypothetical protein